MRGIRLPVPGRRRGRLLIDHLGSSWILSLILAFDSVFLTAPFSLGSDVSLHTRLIALLVSAVRRSRVIAIMSIPWHSLPMASRWSPDRMTRWFGFGMSRREPAVQCSFVAVATHSPQPMDHPPV